MIPLIYPTVCSWGFFLEEQASRLAEIELPIKLDLKRSSDLLTEWLQDCMKSHKSCNWESSRKLPTRFISTGLTESGPVKLCLSKDLAPQTRYFTLSHSRGKLDFLKLTSLNLEDFLIEIPVNELTRTFQDAIALTKACKIGYIWIDSLCIMQDSEEDWLHETSLMAPAYLNAECNIAAHWATDGRTGLFHTRDIERIQPQIVTFSGPSWPTEACLTS